MKKSTRRFLYLSLTSCMFSSCLYVTPAVPDMPYQGTAGRTQYPDTWMTTQPTGINYAPIPDPAPAPATTTPAAPANKPLDLTQPLMPVTAAPAIKPAAAPVKAVVPTPAPAADVKKPETPVLKPIVTAPAATATSSQATDMSKITNTGPIPVATRVPGDPTRVYNPLNPSKTIRVVDKNGVPFPSGKELKVRGTNFHFYVP